MRNVIMILLAVGLGLVAFYLAFQIWEGQPQAPQAPQTPAATTPQNSGSSVKTVLVVVAKRDLYAGDQIDPANDFEWKTWPADSVSREFIAAQSQADTYPLEGYNGWYVISDIRAYNPVMFNAISHIKPEDQTEDGAAIEELEVPKNSLFITGENLANLIGQGYTSVDIVIPETSTLIGSSRTGRGTWQKLSKVASDLPIQSQPLYEGSEEKRYYIVYPEDLEERILLAEEYGLIKLLPTNGRSYTDISSFCVGTRCYEEIPTSEDLNLDEIDLERSLGADNESADLLDEDAGTPPAPGGQGASDLGGGL